MARHKRKARGSSQAGKAEIAASRKPQASTPAPASSKQAATRHGIRPATCMAGMFLALLLGLYLGTLLPDMLATRSTHRATQAGMEPTERKAQSAMNLEPELRQLVADLEKKAAAHPDSAPDWINLGNIYFDSQQPEKAITAYERALELAPRNADVLTDLGIMYRETGRYTRALECFREAVAINPRHENAMYNEGVVLLNDLRKKAEAVAAWQRLMDVNPQARNPQGKALKEIINELQ